MPRISRAFPRLLTAVGLAVAWLAALVSPGEAALVRYGFSRLVGASRFVLAGEVTAARSYRAPFHDLGEVMFTDVTIRITSRLKGSPDGEEVTIQVLGGRIGTAFQLCPESAKYEKGEKVLVFLRDYNGRLWNTGWLQGKYALSPDGTAVRGDPRLPIAADTPLATIAAQVKALSAPGSTGGSSR